MNGLIVVNAYSKSNTELNQANRLKAEFDSLNVNTSIVKTSQLAVEILDDKFENNFLDIDFIVYFDKDKHILEQLKKLKIRVFNNANAIEICDDKLLTHIELANNGIAMPNTIGGVLCYSPNEKYSQQILDKVEQKLGLPVVIKECYGSCGKGVYLAKTREELYDIAEKVKLKPHLFQQFIQSSVGQDIRVIVVGGKCIGSMIRKNSTDFRSNIEIGGVGKATTLQNNYIEICQKVAKVLKLDYCGIDLLVDKNNNPLVCEVNSNAFFGMFEQITKINIAKIYAQYILNSLV